MGPVRRCALALVCALALGATGGVATAGEASPAAVPGLRILPPPALTHWPAIAYPDEARHAAFSIAYHDPALHRRQPAFAGTVLQAGDEILVGWSDALVPARLPPGREGIGGLLPLPGPGDHRAMIAGTEAVLRVVPAAEPWPIAGLRDGFPVDASGAAVVILDRRQDRAGDRAFRWLASPPPRPSGSPVVLGPAAVVAGLPGRGIPCDHPTHPHHAALAALAAIDRDPPRTVVWLPGPESLNSKAWREEDRVLGAVRSRYGARGFLPRLVLVLPPEPTPPHPDHGARLRLLRAAARSQEWEVVDPADGTPSEIAPGVFAHDPGWNDLRRRLAALAE
jgi:hypothetical protein